MCSASARLCTTCGREKPCLNKKQPHVLFKFGLCKHTPLDSKLRGIGM